MDAGRLGPAGRRWIIALSILVGMGGLAAPVSAATALAVYDDFAAAAIDPLRWTGLEDASTGALAVTEATRRIVSGRLQLLLAARGATTSDTGVTGTGRNRLRVNHRTLLDGTPPVTAVGARVAVVSVTAEACPNSAFPSRARAQIAGHFFNDGASGGPGDATGDIVATLRKVRHSRLGDRIEAAVARCQNAACSSVLDLKPAALFARTWSVGTFDVLTIAWEPGEDRFVFSVTGGGVPAETRVVTYGELAVPDTAPAGRFVMELAVENSPANCTLGPRSAAMDARFDAVLLNVDAVTPSRTLTVTVDGPGSVAGSGIACPSTCTVSLPVGTTVELTASLGQLATFVGWIGCPAATDTPLCVFVLDDNAAVTARFAFPVTLTVNVIGPGFVTSPLVGGCSTTCTTTHPLNVAVELTAIPVEPATFVGWSGDTGCSTSPICLVGMSGDLTVSATFETPIPPPE